ncbi:MAG: prephenate dehydratase [Candidatus Levybacteria bacterium]|nr:prephenate dehydratase [Candidatus Levybacteria bacterium]
MKKPTIGIIGGTGKMGQWFASFFQTQNLPVLIAGRNTKLTSKELAKKSDIVIISVPISETQKVIKDILPHIDKHSLLTDLTSFKVMPAEAMKGAKCATLGMHPLFGPSAQINQGLKIVFCKQNDNDYVLFLKNLFTKAGIEIFNMTAEEHDYQMAYIQAFTHAINLLYSKIIFEQKNVLKNKLHTPIFALQSLIMGRVLHQDLKLMSDIQFYNPYFEPVLKALLTQGKNLLNILENEDEKGFIDMFSEEKEFANDFSNFSVLQTDKILKLVNEITVIIPTKAPLVITPSKAKITYLGPEGTFSHQAASLVFSKVTQKKIPAETFFDLFKEILDNEADFAVVPAENSIEGTVRETLDYLIEFSLSVIGSVTIPVHQQLLSNQKDLKDIHTVISHPQALAQCKQWLNTNLPNAKRVSAVSTTSALNFPQKGYAYIASDIAAKQYKIKILTKNIEDNPANTTRFYIVAKNLIKIPGISNKKTLLFLTVYNRVGILRDLLNVFANHNLNLTKLESRPSSEKLWDYHFFVEVEKESKDPSFTKAIKELEVYCPVIRILGQT